MPQTPEQRAKAIAERARRARTDAMDRLAPDLADRLLGVAVRQMLTGRDTVSRAELIAHFRAMLGADSAADTLDARAARITLERLAPSPDR